MANKARHIAAGRNTPKALTLRKPGEKKSNARDRAMKMGDLRKGTERTRARFNLKKRKASEISRGSDPIALPDDPHTRASSFAMRNKLTATVDALTPARARTRGLKK